MIWKIIRSYQRKIVYHETECKHDNEQTNFRTQITTHKVNPEKHQLYENKDIWKCFGREKRSNSLVLLGYKNRWFVTISNSRNWYRNRVYLTKVGRYPLSFVKLYVGTVNHIYHIFLNFSTHYHWLSGFFSQQRPIIKKFIKRVLHQLRFINYIRRSFLNAATHEPKVYNREKRSSIVSSKFVFRSTLLPFSVCKFRYEKWYECQLYRRTKCEMFISYDKL